jgi:hypothetical protein
LRCSDGSEDGKGKEREEAEEGADADAGDTALQHLAA